MESQRETTCLRMLVLFSSPINIAANLCAGFTVPEKNILNILSTFLGISFSQTLSGPLVQVIRRGRALFDSLAPLFHRRLLLWYQGSLLSSAQFWLCEVKHVTRRSPQMWEQGKKNYNSYTYKQNPGKWFDPFPTQVGLLFKVWFKFHLPEGNNLFYGHTLQEDLI